MNPVAPLTEHELAEWEDRARGNGTWSGDDVLRLILEVRYLRNRLEPPIITRDPERRGGAPTIGGTRIAVHEVVRYARHYGGSLERVRQEALPDLTLAELQAAMAYYEAHREAIEEILRRCREAYERAPVAPAGGQEPPCPSAS